MLKKLIKAIIKNEAKPVNQDNIIVEAIDLVNKNAVVKRYDIINALIHKNNYKSYVEIGVRNPEECFNYIQCESKIAVDPGVEGDFKVDFKLTSDEFFAQNTQKFDLIFIDGLHIDDQVKKDIENSINAINPNGTIVLHDCNPPSLHHAREDYYDFNTPATVYWNGTVWKALVDFRASAYAHKYECQVVNTDWGIGIIKASASSKPIVNDNPFYAFRKFEQDRERYIGLISIEQFTAKYLDNDSTLMASANNVASA
jgi:hypothetical protein